MRPLLFLLLFQFLLFQPAASARPIKRRANAAPNRYVVVLTDAIVEDLSAISRELVPTDKGRVLAVYQHALKGFLVDVPYPVAEMIAKDPRVRSVEEDGEVRIAGTTSVIAQGSNSTWNLDRIDQHLGPLNNSYGWYTSGNGVRAYVVDTGVWSGHQEFSNTNLLGAPRIESGFDYEVWQANKTCLGAQCSGAERDPCPKAQGNYAGSHGTAVASIIGGQQTGAAPHVTLVPVRVFQCVSGGNSVSAVTAGLNWIAASHPGGPALVNASWAYNVGETDPSGATITQTDLDSIQTAVTNLVGRGIAVIAAADNWNANVAAYSPANVPSVIAVGATEWTGTADRRWSASNYGAGIDVWAPGANVLSAHWYYDFEPYRTQYTSGTSFSAALVSGIVARNLERYPSDLPSVSHDRVVNGATTEAHGNTILDLQGSPNRLLYLCPTSRCRLVTQ